MIVQEEAKSVNMETNCGDLCVSVDHSRERNPINDHKSTQSKWFLKVIQASLSLFIVAILPQNVLSADYECGVNRFKNESPLTERIVGGNNSLQ